MDASVYDGETNDVNFDEAVERVEAILAGSTRLVEYLTNGTDSADADVLIPHQLPTDLPPKGIQIRLRDQAGGVAVAFGRLVPIYFQTFIFTSDETPNIRDYFYEVRRLTERLLAGRSLSFSTGTVEEPIKTTRRMAVHRWDTEINRWFLTLTFHTLVLPKNDG